MNLYVMSLLFSSAILSCETQRIYYISLIGGQKNKPSLCLLLLAICEFY